MREILFRGKAIDNGEWAYGNLIKRLNYDELSVKYYAIQKITSTSSYHSARVIPETIGQYTGLNDKNGNKIFEGDILQNEQSYVYSREHRNVVVFDEGEFYGEGSCPFLSDEFKYCKVIGNIHDNPELLED